VKVVFGSANYWTSPYQVGSHAWARLFARHDWQVGYLSDPLTPWHFVGSESRARNQERLRLWKSRGEMFESRVRVWTPLAWIAPQNTRFFRTSWVQEHWHQFARPPIHNVLSEWKMDAPDLFWMDSVRHAGWGGQLKPRRTLLRVADWSAGFRAVPASVLKLEEKWIRQADYVVASAESLAERLKPMRDGKPLLTLRNGVDFDFWNKDAAMPPEYAHIPGPRAIYVGAMDDWFDVPLFLKLAESLPEVSFVMIGQRPKSFASDCRAANVHWLGSRPRDQVQAYVRHAQVGIIPFRRNELIECVCPLKLYEYMACGLPVVAARWEELERMQSPATLAASLEEWVAGIRSALGRTEKQGVLSFARDNDWKQRWAELEKSVRLTDQ